MSDTKLKTKDQWAFIALMALGHVPVEVISENMDDTRGCILTYVFDKSANDDFEKWMLGCSDGEMGVIRKVQQAQASFKNNLHRFNEHR